MDCFWNWKILSFYSSSWDSQSFGAWSVYGIANVPCFYRLRDGVVFGGKGKRTAWDTWKAYNDVTPALCSLATTPESVKSFIKQLLERFVILLYDRASNLECVNQAWKQLFTQKGRSIEGIPPTKASLIQLTERETYQAVCCWGQVMIAAPELPSPNEWGWTRKKQKWLGSMFDNSARCYKGL